jgi:uncharacterized LabA/DUF88 family protein
MKAYLDNGGKQMGIGIFIDGGYLMKLNLNLCIAENEQLIQIDFSKLITWLAESEIIHRTYFYDCLPYQPANPSPQNRERLSKKQKFFSYLSRLPRLTIRQGRLQYRGKDENGEPSFEQKRVDLLMGLDAATLVFKDRVSTIVMLAGDSDLIPLVEFVQREGLITRLAHGPIHTYHVDLWTMADERRELTIDVLRACKK